MQNGGRPQRTCAPKGQLIVSTSYQVPQPMRHHASKTSELRPAKDELAALRYMEGESAKPTWFQDMRKKQLDTQLPCALIGQLRLMNTVAATPQLDYLQKCFNRPHTRPFNHAHKHAKRKPVLQKILDSNARNNSMAPALATPQFHAPHTTVRLR